MNWKNWSDGYTGKTLLQDWWKAVKNNFGLVKNNITELEGEVNKKAYSTTMTAELAKKADVKTESGGFAAGYEAEATDGVAVGKNACSEGKGAALGSETYSNLGGAVGYMAETDNGFAGGYNARTSVLTEDGEFSRITAVQLGEGVNTKSYTAKIFDYELVADDAAAPSESDGGKYLKDVGKLSDLQTNVKTDIVGAINDVTDAMEEKVDKEDGMGLSTIRNISLLQSSHMGIYGEIEKEPYTSMIIFSQDGESRVEKILNGDHRETFDHPDGSVTEEKLSSELAEKINGKLDTNNTLKLKSVPHKEASAYPVTLTDHLANEELIKCNIYGNADGVGDLQSGKYKIPIKLTEKNLIPYPYSQSTLVSKGISFNVGNDGIITISGTAADDAIFYLRYGDSPIILKKGKEYTLSGGKSYSDGIILCLQDNSFKQASWGGTFTAEYEKYYAFIKINKGTTVNNFLLKPQLEEGSAATSYEKYKKVTLTAELDTALGEGEYIDIINKKRYGVGGISDITVSGSLKTTDSAKNCISCDTAAAPSKIELSYFQDINKVIEEIKDAVLSQGGNV